MKLKTKSFSYAVKLSQNYNSINVSEGVEVSLEGEQDEINSFEIMKSELITRVNAKAKELLNGKPKNLLKGWMKLTYKVGDKVRVLRDDRPGRVGIIASSGRYADKIGNVYSIIENYPLPEGRVKVDDKDGVYYSYDKIQLIERDTSNDCRVGDTVRIVKYWENKPDEHDGQIGTPISLARVPYSYYMRLSEGGKVLTNQIELVERDTKSTLRGYYESRGVKMSEELKKPETTLEKNACKKAKEDAIKEATELKAADYKVSLLQFVDAEKRARTARKEANEIAFKLGLTPQEKKELI